MRINCLQCGHKIDLGEAYDDYEGQVKCFVCRSILQIRSTYGRLKSVKCVKLVRRPSPEEAFKAAG